MIRQIFYFLAVCLTLITVSCSDSVNYNSEIPTDVQVTKFKFVAVDSVPGLDTLRFAIDQRSGQIYNPDSLKFGSKMPSSLKAEITYSNYSTLKIYTAMDTFNYKGSEDTINFMGDVKIIAKGIDSVTTKEYKVWINIHQINPDTLEWEKLKDDVFGMDYHSSKAFATDGEIQLFVNAGLFNYIYTTPLKDGKTWEKVLLSPLPATANMRNIVSFNNAYYVSTLEDEIYTSPNGYTWEKIKEQQPIKHFYGATNKDEFNKARLIAVGKGSTYNEEFIYSEDGIQWHSSGLKPAEDFPVKGSSSISFSKTGIERLEVVGGRTASGQLTNGIFQFYSEKDGTLRASSNIVTGVKSFTPREGTGLIHYEGRWLLMCGTTENEEYSREIHSSRDLGFTWTIILKDINLPTNFPTRSEASIVVDRHNQIWIIGGKNHAQHKDVWRGRLNRLPW